MMWRQLSVFLGVVLAAPANAMTFREEGNGGTCCEWFAADGEITSETPDAFEQFISDKNSKITIYLNSPGGDLMAGMKLGELIRAKGLDTAVGTSVPDGFGFSKIVQGGCASACAYAFLGGVSRTAKDREIGVHQFYNEATINDPSGKLFSSLDLSVNQLISALVIDYVFRMGADPRVVSIASATPPGGMHFFTQGELRELKVIWSAALFEPWAIEPFGVGVIAYSKTQDKKETATFFCRRDKVPRLLITSLKFKDASQLQEAINSLEDGLEAMGMKLTKEAASVRMVNGSPALELQLTGLDLSTINLGKDLTVHGDVPRVNASYFYHPLSTENATQGFRVVARNCL
jgi:hypothetical protein